MALRETLELDLGKAQQEIDDLERAIDRLQTTVPIDVDVNTRGLDQADQDSTQLRKELAKVEDAADRVADEGDRIGTEYKKGTGEAEKGLKGMGGAMKTFIGLAAVGLVADKLIDFGKGAVQAASALTESTGKAEVVFGEFADTIFEFTSNAPEALRLSTAEAIEMTGTFGNLFVALGLSQQAAADLAPDIVQLGADLGSFNNIEVGEVLEKLRSGLVGEAEPLRALGVNINEATTKAKAFELGLADTNGVVSDAAKVQARWALILEQTTTAQGDAARTADTFAGASATLAAKFEDMKAAVGEELIPALLDVIPVISSLIEVMGPKLADAAGRAAIAFGRLFGIFDPEIKATTEMLEIFRDIDAELGSGFGNMTKFRTAVEDLARAGSLSNTTFDEAREHFGVSLKEAMTGTGIAMGHLTDETGFLVGASRELGDEIPKLGTVARDLWDQTGALADVQGDLSNEFWNSELAARDAAIGTRTFSEAIEETLVTVEGYAEAQRDLAEATGLTEQKQKDLADTMKGLADPVFGAVDAYASYQEVLKKVDEDGKRSAEEQLELARASLNVDAAFSQLSSANYEAALVTLSTALGLSRDEAADLLEQLGFLDGKTFSTDYELTIRTNRITSEVARRSEAIGSGLGSRSTSGGAGGVHVEINNPIAPDLTSNAAQAAQTISAVTSGLQERDR